MMLYASPYLMTCTVIDHLVIILLFCILDISETHINIFTICTYVWTDKGCNTKRMIVRSGREGPMLMRMLHGHRILRNRVS